MIEKWIMADERVYIHEFIDIIAQNRAKYMHHMTAYWSPIGREERKQLCFGVWGTLGSTGRWPEVVNIWEHESWEGLARSLDVERAAPAFQDPSLKEWWAAAAPLRRGGLDRIMVAAPYSRSIDELVAGGVRGDYYAHELLTVPPGGAYELLDGIAESGREQVEALGLDLVAAFRVAMGSDTECLLMWAIPDWPAWVRYERAWEPDGELTPWRRTMRELGASLQRILLLDSPLNPMRTGRQPQVEDRRPLSEI